jgi:hypothetical protein
VTGVQTCALPISFKVKIEECGYKELEPGLYDTRDWDVIRNWAKEIAAAV